jgi:protein TonB
VSVPALFEFIHGTTAPAGTDVIRIGGDVQAAKLVGRVQPVYPPEAKAARVQGTVKLQVSIRRDGQVSLVSVISGDPLLSDAAVEAVKQWMYQPTVVNGSPVQVETEVDINFRLAQ